ncbi:MAG: AEC family transporter [Pseudomonadota bacterium]
MLAVFTSIMPIFLLIVLGNLLRRIPQFEAGFWQGLNKLGFYVLYPVLLFTAIYRADFSELDTLPVSFVFIGSLVVIGAATLASWPLLRARGVGGPQFSSLFQSTLRWNGFIALAVAEALYPPEGVAMVALIMALIIIPIQLATISVVVSFGDAPDGKRPPLLRSLMTNPLIIGVALAIALKSLPFALPGFAMDTLDLLARAALGMGLLGVGAGLLLDDLTHPKAIALIPIILKLFALPALVLAAGLALGINNDALVYMALCAAMPTAMNGYVVAKELGGDAPLYAAIATIQTAISFLSIPLILTIAGMFSGGG